MKTLRKSLSSLNDFNVNVNKNKINKAFKFPNSTLNIKRKKNFLISLYLNQKKYNDAIKNNNKNLLKINLLKNPINDNNLAIRKTRNKTTKDELEFQNNIGTFKKLNIDDVKQQSSYYRKNNYLLLTSLYNLPKIKKVAKLCKKLSFSSHLGASSNTDQPKGLDVTTINNKNIINESSALSSDKPRLISFNLLYNKNDSKTSNNNIIIKKKKRLMSPLSYFLKNKYYSDIETILKDKITTKSFPSDHSLKDKVIYMKKVGAFWDNVCKYCIPKINNKKYKMQKYLSEKKRFDYLDINSIKIKEKSQYKPIFYTSRIINDNKI